MYQQGLEYKNRPSCKTDSLLANRSSFKTYSLTENKSSGRTYFYTPAPDNASDGILDIFKPIFTQNDLKSPLQQWHGILAFFKRIIIENNLETYLPTTSCTELQPPIAPFVKSRAIQRSVPQITPWQIYSMMSSNCFHALKIRRGGKTFGLHSEKGRGRSVGAWYVFVHARCM